jgi:digeranylgeranylglycerophospholipid reductase
MKNNKHDIIVIGGGPIGSYTAFLLAREGLDVGIFERNPVIGKDVNCTGIVSGECIGRFNLSEELITGRIDSIKAISPSGNSFRYQSESPLAYVVNRSQFDRGINMMAVKEGATVYLGASVEHINISDNAFSIRVKTENGGSEEFSSTAGVLATGFELNSFPDIYKRPMSFLFGIQADVAISDVSDVEVYFGEKIAPGAFGWVVPTGGETAKIGLMTKKNPAQLLRDFLQNPLIVRRVRDGINNIRCSPIPLRRIPRSYGDRFMIVGEAAGQVKSTTGGGIYFGLLCSDIAAGVILKAFRQGDFSAKVFGEYEAGWSKKLGPELRAGMMLRNIFARLSDRQIDFLMDLAKRDGILPVIRQASFDWHKDIVHYLIRNFIPKKLLTK